MNTTTFSNESQQRRIFQSGESLIRLLIRHHSIYLNDFPVLTYAMNGSLGILYFFPTLSMGKNSAYSSHLLLNVSGEIPSTAATSLVLRKFFCEFAISSMLLFSKISPLFSADSHLANPSCGFCSSDALCIALSAQLFIAPTLSAKGTVFFAISSSLKSLTLFIIHSTKHLQRPPN